MYCHISDKGVVGTYPTLPGLVRWSSWLFEMEDQRKRARARARKAQSFISFKFESHFSAGTYKVESLSINFSGLHFFLYTIEGEAADLLRAAVGASEAPADEEDPFDIDF